MAKTLIITEKPSVAIEISKILPENFARQDGYLEAKSQVITWAVGHLIELAMPQDYDAKYQRWQIEDLPIIPLEFILKPKTATLKQLKIIKTLLDRNDIDSIINACDAAREGELIFRYIMQFCKSDKAHKRLWLSETTDIAVKNAFEKLKDGSQVENLAKSAIARSQADWLIGINASRAYTAKFRDKLSVGRVQTPTLAIIVNRENEIKNFTSKAYWEIHAEFTLYKAKWFREDEDRFFDKAKAEAIFNKFSVGEIAKVEKIEEKVTKDNPPLLFNLNDLQKEANKKYGLTAEQTLKVAQTLYESKLITYPRTDSRHLTKALADTMPERIQALQNTELGKLLSKASENIKTKKRFTDDSKVSDHTAIIITNIAPKLNSMSENEQRIYILIAKRTLAIFFPPAKFKNTKIITSCQEETFLTKGKITLDPGWRQVIEVDTDDEEQQELPKVSKGDETKLESVKLEEKESKPPKRLSEADLLSAMENAGRFVEDEELKEAMKGKGLGTPATRAAIIEKLISTEYIERKKKLLYPTEKGDYLINLVSTELKTPETTGEWEQKLLEIEKGEYDSEKFMNDIKDLSSSIVEEVKKIKPNINVVVDNTKEQIAICPSCQNPIIENQKGYGCSAFRYGCKFVIWKEVAGKKISKAQAKQLIESGKTDLITGFKSKKGNLFDACLKFDSKEDKIVFEFTNKQ